jgi:hypothetical protein
LGRTLLARLAHLADDVIERRPLILAPPTPGHAFADDGTSPGRPRGHGLSYGDGVGFVIAGPLSLSSDTYDYGSVPISALDLDVDPGYNGTVAFETRWYGVAGSYDSYVSQIVWANVDTTQCGKTQK